MNPQYADIFERRGHPYHQAMTKFPAARSAEFEGLFATHPLAGGESVLDFPAGGGYLANHLGAIAAVTSLEVSPGFSDTAEVVQVDGLARFQGFDRAVCLAALHHFEDAIAVMQRLLRSLRQGGLLHVADVAADSPLGEFLDGFVGRYNLTGHHGTYLQCDRTAYSRLGRVTRCEERPCPWRFDDKDAMLAFCMNLFGLVDCPVDALHEALHRLVGIRATELGVELDWRLLYLDIEKNQGSVSA